MYIYYLCNIYIFIYIYVHKTICIRLSISIPISTVICYRLPPRRQSETRSVERSVSELTQRILELEEDCEGLRRVDARRLPCGDVDRSTTC